MKHNRGFTLLETMVAMAVLLAVGGIVMSGIAQLMYTQGSIGNRTEMHSSVRSATELIQQEIGQAGRVSLPGNVTLSATALVGATTFTVNNVAGIFPNEQLVVDAGANQETITVSGISGTTVSINPGFAYAHANLAPVAALGAFSSGVVPPSLTNGSTGTVLKVFGDLNGDGNMLYVEYTCNTSTGYLYRNEMAFNAAAKPAVDNTMILLGNILPNPNDLNGNVVNCFTYQTKTVSGNDYVTDVAVTLTVQTQNKDPQTQVYQKETKALLNVSPRNVFEAWELASIGSTNRIQPMPASVANLLP